MSDEPEKLQAARRRRSDGVVTDFDGQRLALARRLARLQKTTLAAKAGVTASAISQFEKAQSRPTRTVAAQLALALGVPQEYLLHGRPIDFLSPSEAHFRSLRATPALTRDQALAFAETALAVVDVLEEYVQLPEVALPTSPIGEQPSATEIAIVADSTRTALEVGPGPVPDVVRLLEAKGVVVLRLPSFIDPGVDAFSSRAGHRPIVLLSPQKNDRARSRFDAAHELGHLVMHEGVEPGSKIVENQAHSFAADFLMPRDEVLQDLPTRLDWDAMQRAKKKWGVSLRALAYRAHSLGVWSDAVYRRANQQLTVMGLPEPGSLGQPECSSVLGKVASLLGQIDVSLQEIATTSRLPLNSLEAVIASGSERRERLRVVVD